MISSLELARLCGVSQGTVDRALHNRPGISEATRARILAMAEQHGHLPNPAARELMGRRNTSIVTALVRDSNLRSPFFLDLLGEAARALREDGLTLTITLSGNSGAAMADTAADVVARRTRALVLVLPPDDLALPPPLVSAQPVMSLLLPCAIPGVRNLLPDERAIGHRATRHLLDLGHRRIVHLHGPIDHWAVRERAAGYRLAMVEAGAEPLVLISRDHARSVSEALALGATALFCHHDPLAMVVIRHLRSLGRRVPEDVSVIGVDGSPIMHSIDPSPTSVPYPFSALAAQVVATIHDRPLPAIPAPAIYDGSTCARCA